MDSDGLHRDIVHDTTIICTIISKNYLSAARALMRSIQPFHPDVIYCVLLVDTIDNCFDPQKEPFHIIMADQLRIPNWKHFSFKYDIMELNTAVKPYFLEMLFDHFD